jgi:hypothetical protein
MHVIRDEEDGKLINFRLLVLLFFVYVSKGVGVIRDEEDGKLINFLCFVVL